jgi:uncharacterized protein YdaU (DUF1376 family)
MSGPQWMPFYVGDYLRDTAHLTTEQHGAYLLLLFACWSMKKLPNDDGKLMAITRCESMEKWLNLRKTLEPFFHGKQGFWHQKRIKNELKKLLESSKQRSENGRKGAATRWQHKVKTNNGNAIAPAMARARVTTATAIEDSSSLRSEESKSRPTGGALLRAAAPENQIFDKGAALLGQGKRGLIRRMVVRHGEKRVRDALAAVSRKQPADPSAYFAACCEKAAHAEPEPTTHHSGPEHPIDEAMRQRVIDRIRADFQTGDPPR